MTHAIQFCLVANNFLYGVAGYGYGCYCWQVDYDCYAKVFYVEIVNEFSMLLLSTLREIEVQ